MKKINFIYILTFLCFIYCNPIFKKNGVGIESITISYLGVDIETHLAEIIWKENVEDKEILSEFGKYATWKRIPNYKVIENTIFEIILCDGTILTMRGVISKENPKRSFIQYNKKKIKISRSIPYKISEKITKMYKNVRPKKGYRRL